MGVIDQDVPHRLRRDREEVCAGLPVESFGLDEPKIGFVDQGRRVEGVPGPLAPELGARDPPELRVDQRHELVERPPV
jgi:hypothetical protein